VTGSHNRDQMIANINSLIGKARAEDVPVVWVQHSDDGGLARDTKGWEFVPELIRSESEPLVHKRYGDSFEGTDLETVLAERKVGRLIVTGAQTDACIRSTLHGAFTRGYDVENREAVPAYLQSDTYDVIRTRTNRVEVHHASLIDFLKTQKPNSIHRYVLLDAQDWMTPDVLAALWEQIDRTADTRDARVIFRTAGDDSPLPRKLPAALLAPWQYQEAESRVFHAQDRSSIYGGFHMYSRRPLS